MSERARARAKTREGIVVSNGMDKTIVVTVRRRIKHPRYHKFIASDKKYVVHDEANECNVGDRVVIRETRPISKRKRWRLRDVVERAVKDVPEVVDPT
jgi:small subunit ribosomal protein S17